MTKTSLIRSFNGTLADAEGVIRVDQETFGGFSYAAEAIVSLQADPDQHLWVAERGGEVVGFCSAFPTRSLAGYRWEIDLLAVLPAERGKGIGTALVARAIEYASCLRPARQSRALVAMDNGSSRRAFEKNGFGSQGRVDLLLYEISGRQPRPATADWPVVRAAKPGDGPAIAGLSGCAPDRVAVLLGDRQGMYLVAERDERVLGYAELIPVSTLQYRGWWIESLAATEDESGTTRALVGTVIEWSKADERLDEIGCLVAPGQMLTYAACVSEGFKRIGEYDSLIREWEHV